MKTPESLLEATRMFDSVDKAHDYLTKLRWSDGVIGCPICGCSENYYLATQKRWKCKGCSKQFSVKVGTIFESSPIGLDKWLIALWLIVNAKNGISSFRVQVGCKSEYYNHGPRNTTGDKPCRPRSPAKARLPCRRSRTILADDQESHIELRPPAYCVISIPRLRHRPSDGYMCSFCAIGAQRQRLAVRAQSRRLLRNSAALGTGLVASTCGREK